MDENLEILNRLWTEEKVDGKYMRHDISAAVMYPKPSQKPRMPILIGGYVDKVLKRAGDGGRRLAHLFLSPGELQEILGQDPRFRPEGGKDPDTLLNAAQLPIMVGHRSAAVRDEMMDWLNKEWDFPAHSDCSRDSAIMGTVDECVAQLREQIAAGVQKIIFVPYKYRMDQVETIAREIIPRMKKK